MNTSARAAAFVLLAGSLWGWLQSSPSSDAQPLVSEVAASFTSYQQITKTVVFVNPELAMLCRGASKAEVEAARIRFGPHANTGILIYMNKLAADAFTTNATAFPVGSVIVKQKTIHGYTDKDGKRVHERDNGVGGMVKRSSGYDASMATGSTSISRTRQRLRVGASLRVCSVTTQQKAKPMFSGHGASRATNQKA